MSVATAQVYRMEHVFFDTQILIYALEHRKPEVIDLMDELLRRNGGRLVVSEETLYEFAQSSTVEAAQSLTQGVLTYEPLWLRSFTDIQSEEVAAFASFAPQGREVPPTAALCTQFREASDIAGRRRLDPLTFIAAASDPRTRASISDIHVHHAKCLTELTAMVHAGQLTQPVSNRAFASKIAALLRRGSNLQPPFADAELPDAIKYCQKHRRRLMRECPSFSTDHHLADYRTANPNRRSRSSDSKDLTISAAAFPYVDTFVTYDGYLHNGLVYVKKKLPFIATTLVRPGH